MSSPFCFNSNHRETHNSILHLIEGSHVLRSQPLLAPFHSTRPLHWVCLRGGHICNRSYVTLTNSIESQTTRKEKAKKISDITIFVHRRYGICDQMWSVLTSRPPMLLHNPTAKERAPPEATNISIYVFRIVCFV